MISKEELMKLSELSRIELPEGEVEGLQKDISSILDYVGQVSAAGEGAQKTAGENRNVVRDDVPYEEGSPLKAARDEILDALPRREGDYALTRKILEK